MLRAQLRVKKDFVPVAVAYLTCGKEYTATPIKGHSNLYLIKDDDGELLTIRINGFDFHAGGNWQLVKVLDRVEDVDWNALIDVDDSGTIIEGIRPACLARQ